LVVLAGLVFCLGFTADANAQAPASFVTFEVPGATFTSPASINDFGDVTGWWSSVGYLSNEQVLCAIGVARLLTSQCPSR
jgi:hypothetical protein